jgi:alcohol dehydrogenase class IV
MAQYYLNPQYYEREMELLLRQLGTRHILLVCGKSFYHLPVNCFVESLQMNKRIAITYFDSFSPNPKYEDIIQGVKIYRENKCDFILAVGGGSAIDVAKCIKLFAGLKKDEDYLRQEIIENGIPLFAIPTTAGSGSEATQFAAIYLNGNKCSIEHKSALPKYVLLYPDNLKTLPDYQKKATVCDALSHAVESYWALHSSKESRKLSETAIHLILDNMDEYLQNNENSYGSMLLAANLAGRAINITKTTVAHAMCYKLTMLLGIPHGHAVMLCLPEVWEYMLGRLNACIDKRGRKYLQETLNLLAYCLKQETPEKAIWYLKQLRSRLGFELTEKMNEEQFALLINSVNEERLGNFPIALTREDLGRLYYNVLWGK